MKICMAAVYDIQDPKSWSGTPYSLYRTLCGSGNEITTMNLSDWHTASAERRNLFRHLDVARSIKMRAPVSKLGFSKMNPMNSEILHQHCRKDDYDVLLEFGGFLPGKDLPPYYIYSDASHDLSLDFYRQTGKMPFGYQESDLDDVRRAAEFVRPIYRNARGIFCMSDWMAQSMIHTTGVPAERVHVVYAGANWHGQDVDPDRKGRTLQSGAEIHMLLTGTTYHGKGVDLAVETTELLNREGNVRYHLHVCGLREPFPHGEYVHDHGFVDKAKLTELLQKCDLFVLPSRFDCFGIAFVEAMAYGLPCVGRNICAMPEIIDEGENGELITRDDPAELAEKIMSICGDKEKYARYSASAVQKARQFTWERTAEKMLQVMEQAQKAQGK